jgi:hypothetical protein
VSARLNSKYLTFGLLQGALNNTNTELIKCIEGIKGARDEIQSEINIEEEEKRQIEE